jgi:hypothetical protein
VADTTSHPWRDGGECNDADRNQDSREEGEDERPEADREQETVED